MPKDGIRHVIFDFDGTIVDSAPAILACFEGILAARGITPVVAIDNRVIGPPLPKTLALISGIECEATLQALATEFKARYDSEGIAMTPPYPGIVPALDNLRRAGLALHIATNKRTVPTRLILEHLGLSDRFASVYAIDRTTPPYADKVAMIAAQIAELGIDPALACYIGDKLEDGHAAEANNLAFNIAGWGYGEWHPGNFPATWHYVDTPDGLHAVC